MLSVIPRVLAQRTVQLAVTAPALNVALRQFFVSATLRNEKLDLLKTKTKTKTKKDEECNQSNPKLKKPMSTYLRFVKDQRSEITKQNPNLSFGETSKVLSQTWKTLPYAQKQSYQIQYEKDLAKYEAEKAKLARESPPKRPAGPFIIFYRELRDELMRENPNANIVVMSKVAASKWKMLDAETKEEYRRRYQQEKKEWETRYGQFMVEQKKQKQQQ